VQRGRMQRVQSQTRPKTGLARYLYRRSALSRRCSVHSHLTQRDSPVSLAVPNINLRPANRPRTGGYRGCAVRFSQPVPCGLQPWPVQSLWFCCVSRFRLRVLGFVLGSGIGHRRPRHNSLLLPQCNSNDNNNTNTSRGNTPQHTSLHQPHSK
jgi:hypothetical protein